MPAYLTTSNGYLTLYSSNLAVNIVSNPKPTGKITLDTSKFPDSLDAGSDPVTIADYDTSSVVFAINQSVQKYAKTSFQVTVGGDVYTERVNLNGSSTASYRDQLVFNGVSDFKYIKIAIRSGSTSARNIYINDVKTSDMTPGTSSVTEFDYYTVDLSKAVDNTITIGCSSGWQLYAIVYELN